MVFFDGYNNGYFTYFVRALDENRSIYVLRGDKFLTSASITSKIWLKIHAQNVDDIEKLFDSYAISLIVVESQDYTGLEIHQLLRQYLDSTKFRLLKEIPIDSNRRVSILPNRPPLGGQTLKIYEYLAAKGLTQDELVIEVPVVGKSLRIPLKKLRNRQEKKSGVMIK